jgi:hypothetical protein
MTQAIQVEKNFEREKNLKASAITVGISAVIFLFFLLTSWALPTIEKPLVEEGIEVNLGDSETGLGETEPQIPGEPGNNNNTAAATPTATPENPSNEENTGDVPTNPNADIKPTPTPTTPSPKPVATNPKPITAPIKNPSPKATFPNSSNTNGKGGNNADSYNNSKNQGIAGGNGNQGNPNGNPNSDSYNGNSSTGKSGIRITKGLAGRKITALPKFEDDFNENAKVAVDISLDANGKVISALVQPRGTTTTNQSIRTIAIRKAFQLKFNLGVADQTGTIVFDFKVTN